ncbi:MAG: hypothetical protein K0R82_1595 [Flavipsychrobacter sp.]|jgi:hypothetical protein|nr:hypothetical protein [Flavipsychrobacter sp.]
MKQIITTLAIAGMAVVGVSCNTSAVKEKQAALEAQQKTIDSMKIEMAKKQVIDSMNEVARTQFVVPQMVTPVVQQQVASTPRKSTATKKRSTSRSRSVARTRTTRSNDTYNGGSNSGSNNYPVAQTQTQPVYTPAPAPAPAPVPEKKGWSAKAKGAVIGAGVGAIGGAVINKQNRAKGAVIGGIIGAAGGLGAGAIIDKKNGRLIGN